MINHELITYFFTKKQIKVLNHDLFRYKSGIFNKNNDSGIIQVRILSIIIIYLKNI